MLESQPASRISGGFEDGPFFTHEVTTRTLDVRPLATIVGRGGEREELIRRIGVRSV